MSQLVTGHGAVIGYDLDAQRRHRQRLGPVVHRLAVDVEHRAAAGCVDARADRRDAQRLLRRERLQWWGLPDESVAAGEPEYGCGKPEASGPEGRPAAGGEQRHTLDRLFAKHCHAGRGCSFRLRYSESRRCSRFPVGNAPERFEFGVDEVEMGLAARRDIPGRHRGHDFAGKEACLARVSHTAGPFLSNFPFSRVNRNG
jgi:hypothetical protein